MTDRIRRHGYSLPADTGLAAWEMVIGEHDPSAGRHRSRKSHRGILPDVDFAAAVRDLERRSLLRRVLERVWPARHNPLSGPAGDPVVSGSSAAAVGRAARLAYIRVAEPAADSPAAPDRSEVSRPRAA